MFLHLHREVISVASHKSKSSKASLDNLAARYLNKKKEAEEMEQEYQTKPSADYSLKEGETLRLQLNTVRECSSQRLSPETRLFLFWFLLGSHPLQAL